MKRRIIISGFGGQTVVFTGKLLARAARDKGYKTVWEPSQISEMRGGAASCRLIVSDGADAENGKNVENVRDAENGDVLIAPDAESLSRYGSNIGGVIITDENCGQNCNVCNVVGLDTEKCRRGEKFEGLANMLMLGALTDATDIFSASDLLNALSELTGGKAERSAEAVEYGRCHANPHMNMEKAL